ncbi:predicted protein [Botrytis cinerea T4]|uniref:Uncharacterized protein n=1 Tax=Botryotinia fuckeliana (strain T4) TaxID=999810 RepID=G2XT79_BOTF4|nr:predicted protein [Botrytis cinerea T4]
MMGATENYDISSSFVFVSTYFVFDPTPKRNDRIFSIFNVLIEDSSIKFVHGTWSYSPSHHQIANFLKFLKFTQKWFQDFIEASHNLF